MKYEDRIKTLPRLEFNALVQNTTAQVCSMGKHCRVDEAKDNLAQLRSGQFHSEIMRGTAVWNNRTKYTMGLRAAIVLSVIYEVAVRKGIKLPEQFKEVTDIQQSKHVEELPKDKPSIGESFGLLKHARVGGDVQITRTVDVPISRGFRTDLASSKEEFDALFGTRAQVARSPHNLRKYFFGDFTVTPKELEESQMKAEHPLERHILKSMKHMMAHRADPATMRRQLNSELLELTRLHSPKMYPNTPHGQNELHHDADKKFDELMFGHHTTTPSKSWPADVRASIEQRIYATTYPAFATGEALDKLSETTAPLEKPMRNLEITKPVLVGTTDILTCGEQTLVDIIRDAKEQIKLNADIAEVSTSYAKKAKQLEAVITLCVVQLDKRFK